MLTSFIEFIHQHQLAVIEQPMLIAVSGGADSVVLCHHFHQAEIPFAIAHVNFGLRGGESDADDIFVAGLAETYGVSHHKKYVDTKTIAHEMGVSTQMAARTIRYEWFNELIETNNYSGVAVGTHLNDQIETALLNFSKETGLKGLTGIAPVRSKIYRPLINTTRKEIVAYADEHELTWRHDSSNDDTHYQRNRIRLEVVPVLQNINPSLERSFANSFKHLKQAEDFLEHQADLILQGSLVKQNNQITFPKSLLEESVNTYLVFHWLQPHGFSNNQLESMLFAKQGATFTSSLGCQIQVERDGLVLSSHTNTSLNEVLIDRDTRSFIWNNKSYSIQSIPVEEYEIQRNASVGQFDADKLKFPLVVRSWKQGDRIKSIGLKGSKKVSDIYIDHKLSQQQKDTTLCLESNDQLVWIDGYATSRDFALGNNTKNIYLIISKSID